MVPVKIPVTITLVLVNLPLIINFQKRPPIRNAEIGAAIKTTL